MKFESKSRLGFGIALGALLFVFWLSYRSAVQNTEDRLWVTHTHLVLESLDDVAASLSELEIAERNFVMSGEEKSLASFSDCTGRVHSLMARVRALTADNPLQQKALDGLDPLLARNLVETETRIEVRRRHGLAAGIIAETSGASQETVDQIRLLIAAMKKEEDILMVRRSRELEGSTRRTKTMLAAGNMLALVFLAFAGFTVKQEIENRKRTEVEIRALNANLERRAEELVRSNAELEAFSYSVAHDLRAPLRHIDGFARILLDTEQGRLSAEATACVGRILRAVPAMTGTVDTLLRLAEIGRQRLQLRTVSLNQVVGRVIEKANSEIGDRRVEWRIGKLPQAKCDVDLMTELLSHIVSNALKFSSSRETATITVGEVVVDGELAVFISDNGVGFDMQYVRKLFGPFQRLHSGEDFEGLGSGLAKAQRIVDRHGGRIWAEAVEGQGATFFFTGGLEPNAETVSPAAAEMGILRS